MEREDEGCSSSTAPQSSETDPPEGTSTTIRVKTLDDREHTIEISLTDTVEVLRSVIHQKTGIAPTEQRIIFQGRVLEPARTLQSYGIENGYTVHLVNRASSSYSSGPSSSSATPSFSIIGRRPPPAYRPTARPAAVRSGVAQLAPRLHNLTIGAAVTMSREELQRQRTVQTSINGSIVRWKLNLELREDGWFTKKELEKLARSVTSHLTFLSPEDRRRFKFRWTNESELTIRLPRMPPHLASPAFERVSFIETGINYLRIFTDIMTESNGLLSIVERILASCQISATSDIVTPAENTQLLARLQEIVVRLETIANVNPSNRIVEQERLRQSTPEQAAARLERSHFGREPYFVRHAIDVDLTAATRALRREQARLFEIETIFDNIVDTGAIRKIRERHGGFSDHRTLALSMFYTHVLRIRHHISHLLHTVSEVEMPFFHPTQPQRLLPQFGRTDAPPTHEGVLVINFRRPAESQRVSERVSNIFAPPRVRTDVGLLRAGEWPYLTFYPTGMLQEAREVRVHMQYEEVVDYQVPVNEEIGSIGANLAAIENMRQAVNQRRTAPASQEQPSEASLTGLARALGALHSPVRELPTLQALANTAQPSIRNNRDWQRAEAISAGVTRRVAAEVARNEMATNQTTARDLFLRAIAGHPNVRITTSSMSESGTAPPAAPVSRTTFDPAARGFENETLAAYPVTVEPCELREIARNIASRYRNEALTRIATNLDQIFRNQVPPWDTRLSLIPLSTFRDALAVVLELLASGRGLDESRAMMLAMVRDEEILIRAISECMKSLFVEGLFPTHVNRLVLPFQEYNLQRPVEDIETGEPDDAGPEVLVRMHSDVSQPQSGSLRNIANNRNERRRVANERMRQQVLERRSPTPLVVGRSLLPHDELATVQFLRGPTSNADEEQAAIIIEGSVNPAIAQESERVNEASATITIPIPNTFAAAEAVIRSSESFVQPTSPASSSAPAEPQIVVPPMLPYETPATLSFTSPMSASTTQVLNASDASEESINEALRQLFGTSSNLVRVPRERRIEPSNTNQLIIRGAHVEIQPINDMLNARATTRVQPTVRPAQNNNAPNVVPPSVTVSIDPFLSCTSRHSEINRLHEVSDYNAEAEHMTDSSIEPNPEYANYIRGITLPRRPPETSVNDPEFSYTIERTRSGELSFQNNEDGRAALVRTLSTAIRSLYGHLIETDSIVTLNSRNLNAHPAPRTDVVQDIVSRHLRNNNDATRPFGTGFSGASTGDGTVAGFLRTEGDPRTRLGIEPNAQNVITVQMSQDDATRDLTSRMSVGRETRDSTVTRSEGSPSSTDELITLRTLPSFLQLINRFLESTPTAQLPRGVWGLCLELLSGRLTDFEMGQLMVREEMIRLIGARHILIRQHLIDNQMNGNSRPTREDLQAIAERLANEESFFYEVLTTDNAQRESLSVTVNNRVYDAPWVFRRIEIETIQQLLGLATEKIDPKEFAERVWNILRKYAERSISMLFFFKSRDRSATEDFLFFNISKFVAHMIFGTWEAAHHDWVEGWQMGMDKWVLLLTDSAVSELETFLESVSRSSPTQAPSSSRDPEEGESSAKRRRCEGETEEEEKTPDKEEKEEENKGEEEEGKE